MAGSRKPDTSLMMEAPASRARAATSAWRVSTDTHSSRSARAAITLPMRSHSVSGSTGSEPGRVDSPPTSMIAAPWAASSSPWATAASVSKYSPPSENESGVTFTIPMMRGVEVSKSKRPQCQIIKRFLIPCQPKSQV